MNKKGKVSLIGAGCGDWELITVKGLNRLKTCDSIIYDRLISTKLLDFIPKHCKKIYVGKEAGHHSKTQDEINSILVNEALAGNSVVRLKGGDPFVFGRGGEEIQELQKHNIEYEVVSGISSCIAVPSSAGIPVTHRSISRSFHVITGHAMDENIETEDFSALAKLNGTLIFLMSLGSTKNICDSLITNGKDKDTPCAVISNGTTKDEKVVKGTISNIWEKVIEEKIKSPSILIIGETVNFDFKSTMNKELSGLSIGVTGTDRFTSILEERLYNLDAEVTKINHLKISLQYENIPKNFSEYTHIVFTSTNGIEIFFEYLKDNKIDIRNVLNKRYATIGKSTAKALEKYGIYADIIPSKYTSTELAKEILKQSTSSDRYLILRAYQGSEILTNALKEHNILFKDIKTYTLSCNENILKQEDTSKLDYIIFGSSLGVKEFFRHQKLDENTEIVCIGEVCQATIEELNLKNKIYSAKNFDIDGIVDRLLEITQERIS